MEHAFHLSVDSGGASLRNLVSKKKKRRSKGRYNNLWWCYIGAEFGGARCADLNSYGELLTEPSCIRLYEAAGGASGVFAAPEC